LNGEWHRAQMAESNEPLRCAICKSKDEIARRRLL